MPKTRQEAVVISGKKLARQIRDEARADVEKWVSAGHRRPHLSVILVGDNPASHSYVLNKTRAAADVGKGNKKKIPISHTNMCQHTCSTLYKCESAPTTNALLLFFGYMFLKKKLEPPTGISSETILKHSDISEEELLDLIDKLNTDHRVDGLLVQLPLPGKEKLGK